MISALFQVLAAGGANIDMISMVRDEGLSFLTFTVLDGDTERVVKAISDYMDQHGLKGWEVETGVPVAKVSAVGMGMNASTGVAGRLFAALRSRNISILGISTSDINISVLVEEAGADAAVEALAREFSLTDPEPGRED